jgi:hypothetical protein
MKMKMKSDPDPKLKEAMTEISDILKKHDIAGAITLVSRSHSEHQIHFPAWSAAQGDLTGISFDAKTPNYHKGFEANQKFEETLYMLLQIREVSAKFWRMMEGFLKTLGEYVDLNHTSYSDDIPPDQLN